MRVLFPAKQFSCRPHDFGVVSTMAGAACVVVFEGTFFNSE